MNIADQILQKSEEMFMRYGLKSITMDDIARKLGISKKTLYQYIANKTELIEKIFERHIEEERVAMAIIKKQSVNAIDEVLKISKYVVDKLCSISPTTIYDLQKYYQSTWKAMEAHQNMHVYHLIKENLDWGIRDGLYRKDANADIIAKLYVGKTMLVVDEEVFSSRDYDRPSLFFEYMNYHLHGVVSFKGLELLEQYLSKSKQTAPKEKKQ